MGRVGSSREAEVSRPWVWGLGEDGTMTISQDSSRTNRKMDGGTSH